ncbi:MAG TPA: hemolysin III family protein, partial [Propionibacteriaceae bacterium]|nr:hemolysin III family protein [Propionibacteriaceae bacterium]
MPRTETEPRRAVHTAPEPGPSEPVAEIVEAVKPKLRGWLHAGAAPLALAAGIVLVSLAPTGLGRLGGAVFLAASVLLFGTSGV